jgi:O-antigen/teichoic acid export membrane protein
MAVGFLSTPWLLRMLGQERFGAFRVIVDWFGYLNLLDLGVVGALIACMGPAIARGDATIVRGWLRAGMKACGWIAALMGLAGAVLLFALPGLLQGQLIPHLEIRLAAAILILPSLALPLFVFRAIFELRQMGYLVNWLLIAQAILTTIFTLAAAYLGFGLVGQALATVLAQLPMLAMLTVRGMRLYPRFWEVALPAAESKRIWGLNRQTFIFTLTSQVSLFSDNLIIGWIMGPASVAAFFLTQRLTSIFRSQLQSLGGSTWAGMLELWSKDMTGPFESRLLELTQVVSVLGLLGAGSIAAYNRFFLERWVGAANFAGADVNMVAAVNCWLSAVFSLWHWPIAGTGKIGKWIPYAIAGTLLNISVSIAGAVLLGPVGPLLGTLASLTLVNSWGIPRVLSSAFGISPRKLYTEAFGPLLWCGPYLALVWYIASVMAPTSYVGAVSGMALSALGGLAIWWVLGLSADSRLRWRDRIRLILNSRLPAAA